MLPAKLKLTDSAVRVVDPAEVRLDLVFVSDDGKFWVLVEVQLDEDPDKARKWLLAVAALWNELGIHWGSHCHHGHAVGRRVGSHDRAHGGTARDDDRPPAGRGAAHGRRGQPAARSDAPRARVLRRLDGARSIRRGSPGYRRAGDRPHRDDPRRNVAAHLRSATSSGCSTRSSHCGEQVGAARWGWATCGSPRRIVDPTPLTPRRGEHPRPEDLRAGRGVHPVFCVHSPRGDPASCVLSAGDPLGRVRTPLTSPGGVTTVRILIPGLCLREPLAT